MEMPSQSLSHSGPPSFQSSGRKNKVSFGDFFSVCACHTALGFRTPKSKSKLENLGSKNYTPSLEGAV